MDDRVCGIAFISTKHSHHKGESELALSLAVLLDRREARRVHHVAHAPQLHSQGSIDESTRMLVATCQCPRTLVRQNAQCHKNVCGPTCSSSLVRWHRQSQGGAVVRLGATEFAIPLTDERASSVTTGLNKTYGARASYVCPALLPCSCSCGQPIRAFLVHFEYSPRTNTVGRRSSGTYHVQLVTTNLSMLLGLGSFDRNKCWSKARRCG